VPRRRTLVLLGLATVAGVVLLQLDSAAAETVGAVLLGLVLAFAIGIIVGRLQPQSQPDREREEAAREEFARTGRWPGE
jgi:hypothetical protein